MIEFEDVWSISVCRDAVNTSYIDKTNVCARFRDLLIPPEKKTKSVDKREKVDFLHISYIADHRGF